MKEFIMNKKSGKIWQSYCVVLIFIFAFLTYSSTPNNKSVDPVVGMWLNGARTGFKQYTIWRFNNDGTASRIIYSSTDGSVKVSETLNGKWKKSGKNKYNVTIYYTHYGRNSSWKYNYVLQGDVLTEPDRTWNMTKIYNLATNPVFSEFIDLPDWVKTNMTLESVGQEYLKSGKKLEKSMGAFYTDIGNLNNYHNIFLEFNSGQRLISYNIFTRRTDFESILVYLTEKYGDPTQQKNFYNYTWKTKNNGFNITINLYMGKLNDGDEWFCIDYNLR